MPDKKLTREKFAKMSSEDIVRLFSQDDFLLIVWQSTPPDVVRFGYSKEEGLQMYSSVNREHWNVKRIEYISNSTFRVYVRDFDFDVVALSTTNAFA